jgi:ABC-2 type transport system permease protein
MFAILVKHFLRNKTALIALSIVFIVGLASIFIGKQFLHKQQKAIAATANYQKEHLERLVKFENKEFGLFMYYAKFALVNNTNALTGLAIGQRDVNSSIQAITIRGLEAQKYDTDLANPFNLLMGNLDLSFVIIYLFPLLIITLTFNLLSEEKEKGTWPLLFTQAKSPKKYLWTKLLVVALFVSSVLLFLFLAAIFVLAIPIQVAFIKFVGVSFLYLLFWFALSFLIVALNKTSSINAILLLSCWLGLNIVLPAAVNNYISTAYPVPEALSTMLTQRDGYHKKWDIPKEQVMQQFTTVYPQFKNYTWQQESFNWLWYYAMQHGADVESSNQSKAFTQKLQQRNKASNVASYFIPSINIQLQQNTLAQSSLANHLAFLDSTTKFHEQLRLYFYPKIFTAAPVLQEDWSNQRVRYFNEKENEPTSFSFIALVILSGLLLFFSNVQLNKKLYAA